MSTRVFALSSIALKQTLLKAQLKKTNSNNNKNTLKIQMLIDTNSK
jgi:hypothetical protein